MEKLRNTLNKVLNLLAGLSMTVMVVLTTYQVIVRYIFNSPSTWSEELVGYLFGWSTMLGATIVSGERGHMNIPVLVDRFNPTMRKAFHIFAEVIAFIFSATIGVRRFSGVPAGYGTADLLAGRSRGRVLLGHAHLRRDHSGVFRAEHYRYRQRLHLSGYPGGCRLCKGGSRNGCRCRQGK